MTGIEGDFNAPEARTPPSLGALLRLGAGSAVSRPVSSFVVLPGISAAAVGGCLVPRVNFVFLLVALAPLAASLPAVALAIARGDEKPARQALAGFRHYERCIALFWVPYLIAIGAAIPLYWAIWIDRRLLYGDAHPAIFVVAAAISFLIFAGAVHRFVFAPFAVFSVDRQLSFPLMLEHAAAPMARHRAALLLRLVGLALVGSSGVLLAGLGLLVTVPWALIAAAHLYLEMWPSTAPAP